jgi:hypothetical protein
MSKRARVRLVNRLAWWHAQSEAMGVSGTPATPFVPQDVPLAR